MRVALGVLALLVALGAAGLAYQAIATANDRRAYPPPGDLVDVGGHRLHIHCTGAADAAPTVILDAGSGMASPAWGLVQPAVAAATRVCAYDRAGNGWSEAGPDPRDGRQIASELRALLDRAAIGGPYVLVGHSLGGLYMRAFADAYPNDVAGLALVDSSHPDQRERSPAIRSELESFRGLLSALPAITRLGIVRLAGLGITGTPDLPPDPRGAMTAFAASPEQYVTMLKELDAFPASADVVRPHADYGALPLAVVTAGESTPEWLTMQTELGGLSSNSTHRIINGATHLSLLLSADGAAATSEAILAVVDAARSGRPLG
jgi:pimeloyl-ACP methyl ester carboxylesterase